MLFLFIFSADPWQFLLKAQIFPIKAINHLLYVEKKVSELFSDEVRREERRFVLCVCWAQHGTSRHL